MKPLASPAFLARRIQHPSREETHVFFAYKIPFLIDFLQSYEESSGPDLRKAITRDVLAEQVQFLRGLHGPEWLGCTFELRITNNPEQNSISIHLVAKASGDHKEAAVIAQHLAQHIAASFPGRLYPLKWLTDPKELAEVLEADAGFQHFFEYRRFEMEEETRGGSAYIAYPFHGDEDSLRQLLKLLAGMSTKAVYSVALRPAIFTQQERTLLGRAASICREQEREALELFQKQKQTVDVQSGMLADLYEHYLKTLQDPFLLRVSMAFSDTRVALPLLAGLSSDFSRNLQFSGTPREFVNRRGEFCYASGNQIRAAQFNLQYLEFLDWTPHYLDEPMMPRLRTLVDAVGASAAFRLPVPSIGGFPGIDVHPPSLFQPLPENLLHPNEKAVQFGDAHVKPSILAKHLLVAGTIGSGKTQTTFQLLHDLWVDHGKPFLVIEPVNAEHNDYRALGRYLKVPSELRIFTLGDERTSPLRLNPFHVPKEVILNAHIAGLVACFLAALPFDDSSPLPALFREGIRNIYFAKGWFEQDRGEDRDLETPMLTDLRDELAWLIEQRYGKGTEVAQNMTGASVTRVNALINSSAGSILLARHSLPLDELFKAPTILEMRHLGSDDDKALITGFLLLFLQEYCDKNRGPANSKTLNHVVVLEEAHNLMQQVEDQSSSKAAAVKFFTNMLAENRKYGQGFVVVEQIPTLLAEGAIKNSVTKIMHRMAGADDIEAMGGTMNFKERHNVRAVSLKPGEAFFYTEGMAEATLIRIDERAKKTKLLSDEEVHTAMLEFQSQHPLVYRSELPFPGCRWCKNPCNYRSAMARVSFDRALCAEVMAIYEAGVPEGGRQAAMIRLGTPVLRGARERDPKASAGAAYCVFTHLAEQQPRLKNVPMHEMQLTLESIAGENQ